MNWIFLTIGTFIGACLAVLTIGLCYIKADSLHTIEQGKASWYGEPFHGELTANGETYNMFKVSAAHRTLPFKTRARVINLANGKSIVVRINDRGPFVDGRIIDLSLEAFKKIGNPDDGLLDVVVITNN